MVAVLSDVDNISSLKEQKMALSCGTNFFLLAGFGGSLAKHSGYGDVDMDTVVALAPIGSRVLLLTCSFSKHFLWALSPD